MVIRFASTEVPDPGRSHDGQVRAVLQVISSGTCFAVDRTGLRRLSTLADMLLADAADDEILPLDNVHCTDETVAAFCHWVDLHSAPDAPPVTRIPIPIPTQDKTTLFIPVDLDFIETMLVPRGDMTQGRLLYPFMGMAVFLGSQLALELATGYLAWQTKQSSLTATEDTPVAATVREWFGLEGRGLKRQEESEIAVKYQWCKNIDHARLEEMSEEAHNRARGAVAPPRRD